MALGKANMNPSQLEECARQRNHIETVLAKAPESIGSWGTCIFSVAGRKLCLTWHSLPSETGSLADGQVIRSDTIQWLQEAFSANRFEVLWVSDRLFLVLFDPLWPWNR